MFVLQLQSKIHISNKKPKLTVIEETLMISLLYSIMMDVFNILNPLNRFTLPCSQVATNQTNQR